MNPDARVVLLGPQRLKPTLRQAVMSMGIEGRLATITAGWQEREIDDRELDEHLAGRTVNLELYRRAEELLELDPELRAAQRRRQDHLRQLREAYSLRLSHALSACHELLHKPGDVAILGAERLDALESVRELDAHQLRRSAEVNADFDSRVGLAARPSVRRAREELAGVAEGCEAFAIAGGHVAILLNCLRLLGVADLLRDKPVFAWSAGAMAVSPSVVLFHDSPPQGAGNPEVMEAGLGLAGGVVPLPHVRRRLRLDQPSRIAVFARRFAPAACIGLEDGAILQRQPGGEWRGAGAIRLAESGDLDLPGAA